MIPSREVYSCVSRSVGCSPDIYIYMLKDGARRSMSTLWSPAQRHDPPCNLTARAIRTERTGYKAHKVQPCSLKSSLRSTQTKSLPSDWSDSTMHTSDTYSSGWQRLLITNHRSDLREEVAVDAVAPCDEVWEGVQDARDGHGPTKGFAQAADGDIKCSHRVWCLPACMDAKARLHMDFTRSHPQLDKHKQRHNTGTAHVTPVV